MRALPPRRPRRCLHIAFATSPEHARVVAACDAVDDRVDELPRRELLVLDVQQVVVLRHALTHAVVAAAEIVPLGTALAVALHLNRPPMQPITAIKMNNTTTGVAYAVSRLHGAVMSPPPHVGRLEVPNRL